jgi:hypothetical protein
MKCSDKQKTYILHVCMIVALGILTRMAYMATYPHLHLFADSYGYVGIGQNILLSPSLASIVNPFRPPLYPLFLNAIMVATGTFRAPIFSTAYLTGEWLIMLLQSSMSVGGIIVLYFLTLRIAKKPVIALIVSLLCVSAINLITWEWSLLSEGPASAFTVVLGYVSLGALYTPTWKRFVTIGVLSLIGILIRPSFLTFPVVVFLFISLWYKKWPVISRAGIVFSLILLVLFGYAKTNEYYHGYFGIQNGGDINLTGRIMQLRIPLTPAKDVHPLFELATEYQAKTLHSDVWAFLSSYQIDVVTSAGLQNIRNFNHAIIVKYPLQFFTRALFELPQSLLATDAPYPAPFPVSNPLFFTISNIIFRITQYFYLLTIPLMIGAWIRFLRGVSREEAQVTLLGTLAYSQIILVLISGPGNEYTRFYSVIQPFLTVVIVYWAMRFIRRFVSFHSEHS